VAKKVLSGLKKPYFEIRSILYLDHIDEGKLMSQNRKDSHALKKSAEKKFGRSKREKIRKLEGKAISISRAMKKHLGIVTDQKEREAWARLLVRVASNKILSQSDIENLPESSLKTRVTRFDHLYRVCYLKTFPDYSETVNKEMLGGGGDNPKLKLWKVIYPKSLGVANILIRAKDYREAFAKGCDYACRVHLRVNGMIPRDLTLRVKYVTPSQATEIMSVRSEVRKKHKKKSSKIPRQIYGLQIAAMGIHDRENEEWSIFRYSESKDLSTLRMFDIERESSVDRESFEQNFKKIVVE